MPELTTPIAPESGAQPSPAVADTQTTTQPVEPGTKPEGASVEAKATPPEKATRPEIKVPDSKRKDMERMAKLFPGLQRKNDSLTAEVEQLKSQLAERDNAPKPPAQPKAEGNNATDYFGENVYTHPSVRQLPRDEDSGYVQYKGSWLHPETVIALEESNKGTQSTISDLKTEVAALTEKLNARDKAETEAQYQARVKKAEDGITDSIKSTVEEMLPGIFPNLPDDQKARFIQRVFNASQDNLADLVEEARRNGELTADSLPDLSSQAITKAFDDHYQDYEVFDELQQLKSNQLYKQQNPVKPGGTPGTPAPQKPRTPAERDKYSREAAKRAMDKWRSGQSGQS